MSVHFEKVRIKKITRETPECVSITFDIPETLVEQFAYKHVPISPVCNHPSITVSAVRSERL